MRKHPSDTLIDIIIVGSIVTYYLIASLIFLFIMNEHPSAPLFLISLLLFFFPPIAAGYLGIILYQKYLRKTRRKFKRNHITIDDPIVLSEFGKGGSKYRIIKYNTLRQVNVYFGFEILYVIGLEKMQDSSWELVKKKNYEKEGL